MGAWNDEMLAENILPMDIEVIKSISLWTLPVNDFWALQFEKTGVFSVRFAYRVSVHTKRVRGDWLEGRQSGSLATTEQQLWIKCGKRKYQ
jgi:hypothetical protein